MYDCAQNLWPFTAKDVRTILGREITQEEHFADFEKMLEFTTLQAFLAYRKHTHSYRGFRVGCAVYAHNGESIRFKSRSRVFIAGNQKPTAKSIKLCAERKAILNAHEAGLHYIVGMVIVGRRQIDENSRLITPTLHPCSSCRTYFCVTPGITADTRIVTIEPNDGITERMTVGELVKIHQAL